MKTNRQSTYLFTLDIIPKFFSYSLFLLTRFGPGGTSALSGTPPNTEGNLSLRLTRVVAVILLLSFLTVSNVQGTTMTVVNNSETVNGNTSNPSALIADPGPDGISLHEAMWAADAGGGPHMIQFDPSLKGSTIALTQSLPFFNAGQTTVNGDIDGDGTPDITLDGTNSSDVSCFRVFASDVAINGLIIQNFSSSSIAIFTMDQGAHIIERVTLFGNTISTSGWSAISVYNWDDNHTIKDVEIRQNKLINNGFAGIDIAAAMGPSMANNQIVNITIADNIISNVGYRIAVYARASTDQLSTNNVISGLRILNNKITGHTNSSMLIGGGGGVGCQDNRLESLLISQNVIDGSPVTIEILGGSDTNSTGNVVSGVSIVGNTLRGGGIQLAGATGYNAQGNGIDTVFVGGNKISSCAANGMHICAGSDGAKNNTIKDMKILNNLIVKSNGAGILLHGADGTSPNNVIEDVHILNNTIVENGNPAWAGGININSKSTSNLITGVRIANTILWNNEGNDFIRGSNSPYSVQFSMLADPRYIGSDGNFYSDPAFVDSVSGDYHLLPGSPCIDAGDTGAVPTGITTDLDGKPRFSDDPNTADTGNGTPPIVDMGAYEFQGINLITGDFCGANFTDPDGYVDVWDLMQFADHWHTSPGDNWDPKFDLAGPSFGDPDGYIDVWDLMVFADHWHEGVKPYK